jgi:hypothetical protein
VQGGSKHLHSLYPPYFPRLFHTFFLNLKALRGALRLRGLCFDGLKNGALLEGTDFGFVSSLVLG